MLTQKAAAKNHGPALYEIALREIEGRDLLDVPDRPEHDYVLAVAWMQLAAEQGIPAAREIASRETAKLTPAEAGWVTTLKAQLLRK
jgi:TPR repeat protein